MQNLTADEQQQLNGPNLFKIKKPKPVYENVPV